MRTRDELLYQLKQVDPDNYYDRLTAKEMVIELRRLLKPETAIVNQLPVILAKDFTKASPTAVAKVLKGKRYVADYKIDGCRAKIHFLQDVIRIDSRHYSVENFTYVEKTANFPWLRDHPIFELAGTVIDCEAQAPVREIHHKNTQTVNVLTSTCAIFNSGSLYAQELQEQVGQMLWWPFDCIFYCGQDLRMLPYHNRLTYLFRVEQELRHYKYANFIFQRPEIVTEENVDSLFQCALGLGHEGIMLKDKWGQYPTVDESRTAAMYKWKMTNTIDAFVSGYVPGQGDFEGMVGALLISVRSGGFQFEIGAIQPGPLDYRREISNPDGTLKASAYYRVAEVKYQEWTKEKRLRHAVLVRWRDDKQWNECDYDEL